MDPGHRGWTLQLGGNTHGSNAEQGQSQPSRPAFGPGQQSPPQGHSLPPPAPGGPFPHFHQQPPSLASLAGISQTSPRQPPRPDDRQQVPPGPQLPLPGFSQATGQPSVAERERERHREAEQIQIKEEEDRRHREQQERQRLEQAPPHQTPQGPPMHLHQPVAVGPRTVHGPNGLLANPGPQPPTQMPLGAPSGPGNIFAGGPVQPTGQPQVPGGQQLQPSMLMPFAPAAQQQATQQQQAAPQAQGQGQQPILNDALSYLDQVKVQFADKPDVYNRFLDIMKDFKSGAIDTPGVIGRVSQLFTGNPDLIQGFNTFLPPGYRIECGADSESIRVTTPMGSSIRPMPQPPRSYPEEAVQDNVRPSNGTYTPQPGQQASQLYSPSGRPVGPAGAGPLQNRVSSLEAARQQEQQQSIHQQEQHGVSSLQNAVSAAAGGPGLRAGISPRSTPLPHQQDAAMIADAAQGQPGAEKRGPVEFNHAISYVNKIKNRFSAHPDIYKQFLEILQTYQRESKPIQDVYSQVTHLFKGAPDLLEDFKQFLPESAAQAKAAEAARRQAEEQQVIISNVRNDGMYSPTMSREPQIGTPSHGRSNLPPVGNFAPTPITKDGKRKRGEQRQGTMGSLVDAGPSTGKPPTFGQQGKRMKQTHTQIAKGPSDQPPSSPTLVPRLPEPLPPTTTSAATNEELSFFDRAKKAIGNKNTMNEFLKLCNLFSQDFIDRSTLVYRAGSFLGPNTELMKWFQNFVGYDEKDIVIENKAREPIVPGGRVSLSNCRALGPSYRLLPKRERIKPCSGRDEMCNSVLNDEWASHPTWASEDSGFIAHRKNVHEEGLHRIEEERHDYDYNIEACGRTIQILEPYAQQLRRMSNEDQVAFTLPPGLGGHSETIYKRVIMKLYGREKGHEVIKQLHENPYTVIPVLLNRLKERMETWKMAQREWEKVWREQTQKMFWKSLDHQAANAKTNDRRQFQAKTLQADALVKFEEQKGEQLRLTGKIGKIDAQYGLIMSDNDVVVDAVWLVIVHLDAQGTTDHPRLAPFIRDFVPTFLGIDQEWFESKLKARLGETPVNGDASGADEPMSGAEDSGGERRGRKPAKSTLFRQAVDKGGKGRATRKDREGSNASASRASTPDIASNVGDDTTADAMAVDTAATLATDDSAEIKNAATGEPARRWFSHPSTVNDDGQNDVNPNEPEARQKYRLWANSTVFCFVRMLLHLYQRLEGLKLAEEDCRETVKIAKKTKPAMDLGIMDKLPQDCFADTSSTANYYNQMLQKFVEVLNGDLDFANDGVEECLRRFYLQSGYPMYAFEKIVQALVRYGSQIVTQDGPSKDRSWEILQLWRKDRARETISPAQRVDYKKSAEKLIGIGDTYRIEWDQESKTCKIFVVKPGDPFYADEGPSEHELENRWRYYIASYTSVEDTEGIDKKRLSPVLLLRNMHALGADPRFDSFPLTVADSETAPDGTATQASSQDHPAPFDSTALGNRLLARFLGAKNEEKLILRIALNNYHPLFQPGTYEGFFEDMRQREGGEQGVKEAEETRGVRHDVMREKYVMNNLGMKGLSREEVEKRNEEFSRLANGEVKTEGDGAGAGDGEGEGMEVDG